MLIKNAVKEPGFRAWHYPSPAGRVNTLCLSFFIYIVIIDNISTCLRWFSQGLNELIHVMDLALCMVCSTAWKMLATAAATTITASIAIFFFWVPCAHYKCLNLTAGQPIDTFLKAESLALT